MRKNITELLGTFFLVFAILFSANPLAIGLVLATMIYIGAHISGAHYNPAVTLAFLTRKEISAHQAWQYWVFQIIGSVLAASLYLLVKNTPAVPLQISSETNVIMAGILELLGTMALAMVILSVATNKNLKGNFVYGLTIGLTVTGIAYCIGKYTGCAINPAVAIGPMLVDLFVGGRSIEQILIYVIGPCIGGIFAAWVYSFINELDS